ncbi:hypothetical protein HYALB_00001899 [Hymenoscyphus albidus]|uniref:Enoyl reductase (ER) domain-containing protein n=1 Tax=Hymenoscyphus albidus TaxID=595503 RepID=A0A9N9PXJ7_9HELO|nr:hypothetical protein HYALB_00001899 [Hymenoscyphus albidus]
MVLAGSFPSTPLPLTASHEGSGTIVQLGSSIRDFKIGDRILCSLTYHRCGTCVDCRGAEPQYCPSTEYLGVSRDGSFAEYEVVDGREACLLPPNLSFRSAAPLACAGLTAWGGLVKADLKPGQSVAMVGAGGGLGHLGVQFAKALGLYVIAIDAREEALQLAQQCGGDVVVDARIGKEKVVEEVQKVTEKLGAEATLNFSDHETAAATAAAVTRNHGVMVQIAQPENVSVPFMELVFRDIKIRGSLTGSRLECQRMLETVSKHKIKVQTNAFVGIEEVPRAIELAQSGRMKGKPVILIDLEAIEKEKSSGCEMI